MVYGLRTYPNAFASSITRELYCGNLSRIFTSLSSNAVGHCRRSAQALLTLASPSAQAAQAAQPLSCSPFWWLIMIYTI